jgi:20S proteasome alpha/beta subunit
MIIVDRGHNFKAPKLERKRLTICIAAVCELYRNSMVVLCTDRKASSSLGSTETAYKDRPIGKNLVGLYAGDESGIIALHALLKKHMRPVADLDETNVKVQVAAALDARKRDLVERLVQGRFAFSYDEFLKHGKERLTQNWFARTEDDIAQITLEADCILAGFIADFPLIVTTDRSSNIRIQDHFASIGEGGYLADSVLLHRGQNETKNIGETLYNVYEAKRYAERVGSVGPTTTIAILHQDKAPQVVTPEGMDDLAEKYKKFGPQSVPFDLKFEPQFLATLFSEE